LLNIFPFNKNCFCHYQPGTIPAGCERAAKVIKDFNFPGTCTYNLQIISELAQV